MKKILQYVILVVVAVMLVGIGSLPMLACSAVLLHKNR